MVPAPAGVRIAPGRPRVHRGVEPRGLAHTLAAFRSRARAGRECPGPCHRERQGNVRARSAISSTCWRRPWMHRKCSRRKDLKSLRVLYAISRRNCVGILCSPHPTSSRSVNSNVNWQIDFRRRGNFAESRALLMDSLDLLEGRRHGADDPDVARRMHGRLMELGQVAQNQRRFDEALVCFQRRGGTGRLGPQPATPGGHRLNRRIATSDRRAVRS